MKTSQIKTTITSLIEANPTAIIVYDYEQRNINGIRLNSSMDLVIDETIFKIISAVFPSRIQINGKSSTFFELELR